MAGSKKGRVKKNKGKADLNKSNPTNSKLGKSSLNLGMKQSDNKNEAKESGNKSVSPTLNLIGESSQSKSYEEQMDVKTHDLMLLRSEKLQNELKRLNCKLDHKLDAVESENALRQYQTRRKKNTKKVVRADKQSDKIIKGEIEKEKQKIFELEQEFRQANKANEQAEKRLKQAIKEKEQARGIFLEEQRLNREVNEETEKMLASLKQELEAKRQSLIEKLHRLRLEICQLHQAQDSSQTSSSSDASDKHNLSKAWLQKNSR